MNRRASFGAFFVLTLTLLASSDAACNKTLLSFEKCEKQSDCLGGMDTFPKSSCLGRNRAGDLKVCPNTNVDVCACVPNPPKLCSAHDECPDREFCGESPLGGRACTGCGALNDPDIGFVPVGGLPNDRCVAGNEHPPCGNILDRCSTTLPCRDDAVCLHLSSIGVFNCPDTGPCVCSLPSSGNTSLINAQPCTNDNECSVEGEGCAQAVGQNASYCISCDAVHNNRLYKVGPSSVCYNATERRASPAHYYRESNGKTFDTCHEDAQCAGDRKCYIFDEDELTHTEKCPGGNTLCICKEDTMKSCSTGSDCEVGESCVTAEAVEVSRKCISNSFIQPLSISRNYQIIGDPNPNPTGRGLTDQRCKYDWNCAGERRCTHITEQWGGCAGRGACMCKPLDEPECSSDDDCVLGEACAKYVGISASNFCMAEVALREQEGVFIGYNETYGGNRRDVYSRGLTGDWCWWDENCKGENRTCSHFLDLTKPCNGRSGCTCAMNSTESCEFSADCSTAGEICVGYKGQYPTNATRFCQSADSFNADTSTFLRAFGEPSVVLPSPSTRPLASFSSTPRPSGASPTPSVTATMSVSASNPPVDVEEAEPSSDPSEEENGGGSTGLIVGLTVGAVVLVVVLVGIFFYRRRSKERF